MNQQNKFQKDINMEINNIKLKLNNGLKLSSADRENLITDLRDVDFKIPGYIDTKGVSKIKEQFIESQSVDGYCYVRLIYSLPNFKSCTIKSLDDGLIAFMANLKDNPYGSDILTELFVLNQFLGSKPDIEYEEFPADDDNKNKGFIKSLMNSTVRYSWEEFSGVHHVDSATHCDHTDVVCNHGWSSRAVFCLMVSQGVRVGSELNFDDFFTEIQVQSTTLPTNCDENTNNDTKDVRDLVNKMNRRSNSVNLENVIDDKNNDIERLNQKIKQLEDQMTSLSPEDSSSNIGRYNEQRQYMNQGTVFSLRRDGTLNQEIESDTVLPLTANQPLVRGFITTKQSQTRELMELKKVKTINGLAKPFQSERLNVLIHFYTAIEGLRSEDSRDNFDAIIKLIKYKPRTPSEDFAKQVLDRTFDFDQMLIVANPFKLPFIEIGMQISDNSLNTCISMLDMEYKMLWFDTLKGLKIPSFHKSFDKYKENKLSSSVKSSKLDVIHERPTKYYQRSRRPGSRSILSFS